MIYRTILAGIFFFTSQSLWASLSYDDLNPVWPADKPRPTAVLDIDYTICLPMTVGQHDMRPIVRAARVKFPEAILIPYFEQQSLKTRGWHIQAFFPDVPEAIIQILSWGWNVHFFSAAVARRNEKVIPIFLKEAFATYFQNPDEVVERLLKDRIKIFSSHHLVKITHSLGGVRQTDEPQTKFRKDLYKIGLDIQHAILVDDTPDYVSDEAQQPLLALSRMAAILFSRQIRTNKKYNPETDGPDATYNAAYIIGILSHCHKAMLGTNCTLREALHLKLKLPAEADKSPESKWMIQWPDYEADENTSPEEDFKFKLVQDAINAGQDIILEVKKKRIWLIQSLRSDKPYNDLLFKTYQVRDHSQHPVRSSQIREEDMPRQPFFQHISVVGRVACCLVLFSLAGYFVCSF